jgi:serine phosphatase RsbU (regulator of sigma subunit)
MGAALTAAEAVLPAAGLEIAIAKELAVEETLDRVQRELSAVRGELETLQRRDDVMRYHMQRIDEELKLAARLQQDFLPRKLPTVGPVKFHTLFRPAGHVSGDLYDVMRLDEHHVGFYMADAVGHGMPAALLTMFLKQALVTKEITPKGYRLLEPSATMARLNDALVEQNLSHATFATAIYGYINTQTFEVVFSRGGHPNPLVLGCGGEMRSIESDGSLLGIFPCETFEQTRIQLQPGERFFIYSDGVEFAFAGIDALETTNWRLELQRRAGTPTEQILRDFADEVDRFGPEPSKKKDDLTMIVLDVQG